MSYNSEPYLENEWLEYLQKAFMPKLADRRLAVAFLHHLDDLQVLSRDGRAPLPGISEFLDTLSRASQTREGFMLALLLDKTPHAESIAAGGLPGAGDGESSESAHGDRLRVASDLSNLQIVKKVEKQMAPFLKLEEHFFKTVVGKRANADDARLLFEFFLSNTVKKEKPRAWEQLSRRRHSRI